MTDQELRKQIDAFFEGGLSDSEEQELRVYLVTHEVPQEFHGEKRIFGGPGGNIEIGETLPGRFG